MDPTTILGTLGFAALAFAAYCLVRQKLAWGMGTMITCAAVAFCAFSLFSAFQDEYAVQAKAHKLALIDFEHCKNETEREAYAGTGRCDRGSVAQSTVLHLTYVKWRQDLFARPLYMVTRISVSDALAVVAQGPMGYSIIFGFSVLTLAYVAVAVVKILVTAAVANTACPVQLEQHRYVAPPGMVPRPHGVPSLGTEVHEPCVPCAPELGWGTSLEHWKRE